MTCTILLIAGSHVLLLLVPDVLLTFILDDPVELVHNGLLILTASQGTFFNGDSVILEKSSIVLGAVNVFIYLLMQPELRPTFTCKTSVAAAPLVCSPPRERRLSSIYACRHMPATSNFVCPRPFALNQPDPI